MLLMLVCLLVLLTPSTSLLPTRDDFKSYSYFTLARQWFPGACKYPKNKKCIPQKWLPKAINYWTIHGLWPSRKTHSPRHCEKPCPFDISTISEDTKERMKIHWPNFYRTATGNRDFWEEQYCKHGTCCTDKFPSIQEYFSAALDLNEKSNLNLDKALNKAGIKPHPTKKYTFEKLDSAIEQSFGKTATYWCRSVKGKQQIKEIHTCLDRSLSENVDCPINAGSCDLTKPFYLFSFLGEGELGTPEQEEQEISWLEEQEFSEREELEISGREELWTILSVIDCLTMIMKQILKLRVFTTLSFLWTKLRF